MQTGETHTMRESQRGRGMLIVPVMNSNSTDTTVNALLTLDAPCSLSEEILAANILSQTFLMSAVTAQWKR